MNVKLKNEGLPTRCEICHKADLFDPTSNYCKRCSILKLNADTEPLLNSSPYINFLDKTQKLLRSLSLSIGEVSTLTFMLLLIIVGACLGGSISKFIEVLLFLTANSLTPLSVALGAILGFLSLYVIGQCVILKTTKKLSPLIDIKLDLLIKKSLTKK